MHIIRVEPFHVNWGKSTSAWVRLWTDTGLYGVGEASPMAHGNASLEIIASAFAPMLVGTTIILAHKMWCLPSLYALQTANLPSRTRQAWGSTWLKLNCKNV